MVGLARLQAALIVDSGPLTATKLANLDSTSPTLAIEQLKTAERLGLLCRDDSLAGLRFYTNRFA